MSGDLQAYVSSISLQSEDTAAEVSPDSDEFVVELMTQCELKMQQLHEELQGKDVAAIMKEMEEEEVSGRSGLQRSVCFWTENCFCICSGSTH